MLDVTGVSGTGISSCASRTVALNVNNPNPTNIALGRDGLNAVRREPSDIKGLKMNTPTGTYPLLEALLSAKEVALKAVWTIGDVAALFGVRNRAIYA
jgi:hypothetical protein